MFNKNKLIILGLGLIALATTSMQARKLTRVELKELNTLLEYSEEACAKYRYAGPDAVVYMASPAVRTFVQIFNASKRIEGEMGFMKKDLDFNDETMFMVADENYKLIYVTTEALFHENFQDRLYEYLLLKDSIFTSSKGVFSHKFGAFLEKLL